MNAGESRVEAAAAAPVSLPTNSASFAKDTRGIDANVRTNREDQGRGGGWNVRVQGADSGSAREWDAGKTSCVALRERRRRIVN